MSTENPAAIIVDTPDQIEAYRILATVKGLELEIRWGPRGGPTRGMALGSANRILAQYNGPGTAPRTRKAALTAMLALCQQLGIKTTTKGAQ